MTLGGGWILFHISADRAQFASPPREFLPSVPLGQVEQPSAWRHAFTGVVTANALGDGNIVKV